jgi:M6 family metalloprotease-like protein
MLINLFQRLFTGNFVNIFFFDHRIGIIIIILSFLAGSGNAIAVPAWPHPIEYTQPNGSVITILLKGDEKVNWAVTPDGYTILVTKEGYYEYAIHDEHGDMVFSGIRVSETDNRSTDEIDLLIRAPKDLFFSERQVEMMLSVWEMREKEMGLRSFPVSGDRTMLCILMQTPDKPFTKTQEEFDALLNQLNYSIGGATGSVKDYYLQNSYGQFNLTVDVVGPYTAQNNMAYYGSTWGGARQLATEAVHLANQDVNYADYDNSGNGQVDGFYMIFSGYGEEAGGGSNTIWSHAWSIEPVQLDGVWISRYACSPELRGNSGSNITRIGVVGHELGHVFGAPDYYDTDGSGSGGSYPGTGSWDMMAGGTWNNGGATPAHHNAYTKVYIYNWAEATILNKPGSHTLEHAAVHSDSFYRINTNTPGEYYVLENRHRVGFDSSIPGQGLIIYHVHREVAISGNSINVGHPQKMYPVCAGAHYDPSGPPWSYGDINTNKTPFPGTNNQTFFLDYSTPSMLSWAGQDTNKPITNIARDNTNQTVSFDFLEDVEEVSDWMHWDDGMHNNAVGLGSEGIYQIAVRFLPEDLHHYEMFSISSIRLYVNNPPSGAAIKVWQGESQESLEEIAHKEFDTPSGDWIEVSLDLPILINNDLELWIGVEYDDPGQGVFPASIDHETSYDGKGNMIRMDIDDHESWVPLSDYNLIGDWNIQARLILGEFNTVTYSVTDGGGMLAAKVNDIAINSGDAIPAGETIVFTASPHRDFIISEWSLNGQVIEEHMEHNYVLDHLEGDVDLTVSFTSTVDVSDTDMRGVKVYPNPASDRITIESPVMITLVRLLDINGQILQNIDKEASTIDLNLNQLPAGLYVLQIYTGKKIFHRKIQILR